MTQEKPAKAANGWLLLLLEIVFGVLLIVDCVLFIYVGLHGIAIAVLFVLLFCSCYSLVCA